MRGPGKPVRLAVSDDRRSGRPVLFVHGIFHNRFVWAGLADALSSAWRPIAVDLRGHGESDWSPEGHYDVRDYALDLPAALDALGIERTIVVAHSLGGNAATLFAAAHPERVEALALLDTGPVLSLAGMGHAVQDAGQALASYASIEAFRARLAMMHPLADAGLLARLAERGVVRRRDGRFEPRIDPGALAGSATSEQLDRLEVELWDALGRIPCPVLVVRGGRSALLSEDVARRMVDDVLCNGRLVTLERAGHAVMLDDGPGLRSCLEAFLEQ